jgi:hypothetical protein
MEGNPYRKSVVLSSFSTIRRHLHSPYHCRNRLGRGPSHRHPWRPSFLLECQRCVEVEHRLPQSQRCDLALEVLGIGRLVVSDRSHRIVTTRAYSVGWRPLGCSSAAAAGALWALLALRIVFVIRTRPDGKSGLRPSAPECEEATAHGFSYI